jgi:hypothetical protein
MVRERKNKQDANAIAIILPSGEIVGHLPRDLAAEWAALLDAKGIDGLRCTGRMQGGWDRRAKVLDDGVFG